jgi:hypothetical protein
MLISQVSSLTGRAAALLAKMIELAPIFRAAQFKLDPSTFLNTKETLAKTGTAARAPGAAAQRDAQSPSVALSTLAAYTREYSIDELYLADANVGNSPEALKKASDRKLAQFAVAMAEEIQDHMFIGTAASNQMLGISTLVLDAVASGQTARLGFTQAELAAMNKNISLQLTSDNYGNFLETLEKEIANVPNANAIMVNTNLAARLTTIARVKHVYGQINDAFGGVVETILSVPIIKLPTTAIIQTESDGTNSDCTSMYIARFAEELGLSFSTNSGFMFTDFPNTEVKPNAVARLSMHLQLSPEKTNAVKRLSRIRL